MDIENLNKIRSIISKNTPSYMEDNLFPQDQIMSTQEHERRRVYAKEPGFMGKLGAYSVGVSGEEYGNIYGEKEGALFGLGSSAADGLHALGGAKVNRSRGIIPPVKGKPLDPTTPLKRIITRIKHEILMKSKGYRDGNPKFTPEQRKRIFQDAQFDDARETARRSEPMGNLELREARQRKADRGYDYGIREMKNDFYRNEWYKNNAHKRPGFFSDDVDELPF